MDPATLRRTRPSVVALSALVPLAKYAARRVPWPARDGLLPADEIPDPLKTGLFRRQPHGPFVGLYGEQRRCVAVSWYYHGFRIGDTDFEAAQLPNWRPDYQATIQPGIYLYAFSK